MIKAINNSESDNKKLSELEVVSDNKDKLDRFDFSRAVVRKPWGHEYLTYKGKEADIWVLFIKKDAATSLHCHVKKKTVLVIVAGKAQCSTLDQTFDLEEGDCLVFEKKVFHSTKAVSERGVILLELEVPPEKTDLVRAQDEFGRKLKGYELQNEMCFDLSEYERVFLKGEQAPYRKIGNMNISVKNIQENTTLQNHLNTSKDSLNILLSGELVNKDNEILSAGDIIKIKDVEDINSLKINNAIRILHVDKDILDFD